MLCRRIDIDIQSKKIGMERMLIRMLDFRIDVIDLDSL